MEFGNNYPVSSEDYGRQAGLLELLGEVQNIPELAQVTMGMYGALNATCRMAYWQQIGLSELGIDSSLANQLLVDTAKVAEYPLKDDDPAHRQSHFVTPFDGMQLSLRNRLAEICLRAEVTHDESARDEFRNRISSLGTLYAGALQRIAGEADAPPEIDRTIVEEALKLATDRLSRQH